ncbi:uncharacterized protein BJ212DRAFT_1485696 [Suillus subaureus]|uniref:Uncharacterized protein n=1 Tax=Suillus subaureus TaxID=48587 RepID=A0A9P7DZR8_9AGAM|nr:uncharacterized protein BJ212DRAFT_1485696 [Suillus subaureus]KAG1807284.1 hypothetical protein BJ212DRAFT_1485696 [Suillus subaureus]
MTIYEFDTSTLETVGTPFEGHTSTLAITSLALSFHGALLLSAADIDDTIKLCAFESRQLLASFDVQSPITLALSSDSRQFAYAVYTDEDDDNIIYICNTPPDILAQTSARKKSARRDLLNSDAAPRLPAGRRRSPTSVISMVPRPPPTINPQQSVFLRLSKLFRFSPRTSAVYPSQNSHLRDPLDVPATLPLPSHLSGQASTPFDHASLDLIKLTMYD